MQEKRHVMFDRSKLARFKSAYKKTVEEGKTEFKFDGDDYVTTYAKYLIEHLNNRFGIKE